MQLVFELKPILLGRISWLSLFCFDIAPRATRLKKSALPSPARDSSEVAYALNRRCLAHTGNDGLNLVLWSSNLSLLVEFTIQEEAMAVARFIPKWAHYLADVNTLLLKIENYKGSVELIILRSRSILNTPPPADSTYL